MKKFLNGISRALCVMSFCVFAGCSYAGDSGSGNMITYAPGKNGGLEGQSLQTQGAVIKESWMDTNGNIKIGTNTIAKTSEVVAVPTGTVATITMPDDSSWSTYYSGSEPYSKGVFLSGRKIKLDPFVMSQYEVTQKLYMEVMGLTSEQNPSYWKSNAATDEIQENRPIEKITWYKACAFCNELTRKTFGNTDQCVYYNNDGNVYTIDDASKSDDADRKVIVEGKSYNTETHKWTKTGYRLPTEAEWEFCARGGDPNADAWCYAYAGVQTEKEPSKFISLPCDDAKLDDYGWYKYNSNRMSHEVGKKRPNTLGLYDMSGNVKEWCYDWFDANVTKDDVIDSSGNVLNPLGSSSGSYRILRGGYCSYYGEAYTCAVSCRFSAHPYRPCDDSGDEDCYGFRLVRSTN